MVLSMYALQQPITKYLQEHPQFLQYLDLFNEDQKQRFIALFDEQDIVDRAVLFFDSDTIYCADNVLYYEHKLRKRTYKICIESHRILIYDHSQNPFLPFLKRIYRNFLTCEEHIEEETSIKVL